MIAQMVEKTVLELKKTIDSNGPNYLADKPYQVYRKLLKSNVTDKETAGAILYFIVNDMLSYISRGYDFEELSRMIQMKCHLKKDMAERLTTIFLSLYSRENESEWGSKFMDGLTQFLNESFTCSWKGFAVWRESNGGVNCHYEAEIVLYPTDMADKDEELLNLLDKNPFMKKETIKKYFEESLCKYLDYEFSEYCTCEPYYQPTAEDFDIYDRTNEWCRKNGFKLISCEGDGYDDGYEPNWG